MAAGGADGGAPLRVASSLRVASTSPVDRSVAPSQPSRQGLKPAAAKATNNAMRSQISQTTAKMSRSPRGATASVMMTLPPTLDRSEPGNPASSAAWLAGIAGIAGRYGNLNLTTSTTVYVTFRGQNSNNVHVAFISIC